MSCRCPADFVFKHVGNTSDLNCDLGISLLQNVTNYFSVLFSRLVESIDRNTEVMQCAMETMDILSRSTNKTPLPDDTDFIIPDAKRSDKVSCDTDIY